MLAQLEQQFFWLRHEPNSTIIEIACKYCAFTMRIDDANLEQAHGAAELFAKHLRVTHGRILHEAKIER